MQPPESGLNFDLSQISWDTIGVVGLIVGGFVIAVVAMIEYRKYRSGGRWRWPR